MSEVAFAAAPVPMIQKFFGKIFVLWHPRVLQAQPQLEGASVAQTLCPHGQGLLWSLCLWEHGELRAELSVDPQPGQGAHCSCSGVGAGAKRHLGFALWDGSLQTSQRTSADNRTLPGADSILLILSLSKKFI